MTVKPKTDEQIAAYRAELVAAISSIAAKHEMTTAGAYVSVVPHVRGGVMLIAVANCSMEEMARLFEVGLEFGPEDIEDRNPGPVH